MSDSDLLSIFWDEVSEYLETLNGGLLQAEMLDSSGDKDAYQALLREMNRVAHSMKGAARAVGLTTIETIGHHMEEVFGAAQQGTLELSPGVADALYDGLDLIQNIAQGDEIDDDVTAAVVAQLDQVALHAPAPDATTDSRQMEAVSVEDDDDDDLPTANGAEVHRETGTFRVTIDPAPPGKDTPPQRQSDESPALATGQFTTTDMGTILMRPAEETVRVTVGKLDRLMAEATELLVARMHGEEQQRTIRTMRRKLTRWQREWRGVRAAYIRLVRRLQDEDPDNVELPIVLKFLEYNQRMIGETIRGMQNLLQAAVQYNTHLSTLSEQIQDDISAMRMMPFESVIGGFQRMMRDLARDTGKQVQLDVEGSAVEIDKTVLDALKEPLMHLLRNAVDHGIESPDDRTRLGKAPTGHIKIEVEQRGSEIVLRVSDDGRGIDPKAVRQALVKRGLMSDAEAEALSEDEAQMSIFHSGLTTSAQVTSLSGRGLGMDIVRDRVESLRGRVSLHSVLGEGTTTTLNVPVSLTRIRCVMLRIGDQEFAVPSAMVLRMGDFQRDDVFTAEGREMVLVNDRPIQLASLGTVLDVPVLGSSDGALKVLTLQATDRVVAFEVDELYSEQELVLKPLGEELARAPFVAGAALLGTGDVIIVLDANDLVRQATGVTIKKRRMTTVAASPVTRQRIRVLVVDDSITTRTLEKNILETAGFEVHVAIDGVEAWHILTETDFDVVISDVEMPNMTGLELASRIKNSQQFQHLPVILLTSLAKPEQREAGLRAGADAYLVKSQFDQGELLQTIYSVI